MGVCSGTGSVSNAVVRGRGRWSAGGSGRGRLLGSTGGPPGHGGPGMPVDGEGEEVGPAGVAGHVQVVLVGRRQLEVELGVDDPGPVQGSGHPRAVRPGHGAAAGAPGADRKELTPEIQSRQYLVCLLLLENKITSL